MTPTSIRILLIRATGKNGPIWSRSGTGTCWPLTQGQFPKPGFRTPDNEEGRHPIFLLARNGNWEYLLSLSSVGDNVTGNALTCSHIKNDTSRISLDHFRLIASIRGVSPITHRDCCSCQEAFHISPSSASKHLRPTMFLAVKSPTFDLSSDDNGTVS